MVVALAGTNNRLRTRDQNKALKNHNNDSDKNIFLTMLYFHDRMRTCEGDNSVITVYGRRQLPKAALASFYVGEERSCKVLFNADLNKLRLL